MCSVLDHAPDWVLFTSGVLHSVPLGPLVLSAINSLNGEITLGRYIAVPSTVTPARVSIVFQKGVNRRHLIDPGYVKSCLTENGERVAYGTRSLIAEHAVFGELYDWKAGNIERLYSEHR